MPRKRSSGDHALYYIPSRKLWRAVADDGYGPDGKRKQISVTARKQQDAKKKLDAKLAEIAEHGTVIDKSVTLAEWAQTWLETVCAPHMKPNGLKAYESIIRKWITPTIGRTKVALVKPSDVRAVTQAITKAGLSSSTSLKAYNILNGMLEAARMEGLCGRNVAQDVITPKAAISTVRALTAPEALGVLQTSRNETDGSRWWVAVIAGLRQGERLGLLAENVDLEHGLIHVEWSLSEIASVHGCGERVGGKWPCGRTRGAACPQSRLRVPDGFEFRQLAGRLCLKRPKSGKARTVPIPPGIAEMIREHLGRTTPNPHNLVWSNTDGSPITAGQDSQEWRNLLHRAGLITAEQVPPPKDRAPGVQDVPGTHSARHTTATVLMNLGVDAKIVGEIVGHQSERVTRGYQHVTSAAAGEAMGRSVEFYTKQLEP